ncbi:Holliday junction branch migration protein RuvA [Hujiaoplasma nucleasis]|uniref:Holliday junction branch migration complex subunit RuvA n=1 Tax=Hujiaoplasma nucleasis TaxID=2725268 RepID=A0A7L6N368_9MOLU|nr:Holliday junction branch migration protein RuvA [Hujiaoplasma nucleasis]QLY39677.1 Holliday junction branch migration protein RuvA [Hujiaoplasma nucleasis]
MYSYIKGIIKEINPKYVTLENHGIGYLIITPNPFNFKKDEEVTIYLYQKVSEDAINLFGFKSIEARELFIKLISVSGIGPKSAVAILASGPVNSIADAIESGDAKYLQKFPGIGPKSSKQIILDLQGKLDIEPSITSQVFIEVEEALKALGYGPREISKVIPKLDESKAINDLIKDALSYMLK